MSAFLLVIFFPVVVSVGFGVIYGLLRVSGAGRESGVIADSRALVIYFLLLTIPLMATWIEVARGGTGQRVGMQLPGCSGVEPMLSGVVSLPLAVVLGVLLYYAELVLAARLRQAASAGGGARFRSALEGRARRLPSLRSRGMYMWLSVAIALVEEFIWRGFLIVFLVRELGMHTTGAIVLAGALFGSNHVALGLQSVVAKTVDGIMWGGLAVMSGELWSPFVSHTTFQYMVWRRSRRWEFGQGDAP